MLAIRARPPKIDIGCQVTSLKKSPLLLHSRAVSRRKPSAVRVEGGPVNSRLARGSGNGEKQVARSSTSWRSSYRDRP